jgi:predicted TPR repeat methyltransferase
MSGTDIDRLLADAEIHLSAGALPAAAGVYRAVLAARPDHSVALHGLGWVAHRSGDQAAAIDLLRRALDADPSAAGCWNNLGIVYAAARRPADAAEAYGRAIALQPEFAAAHLNLGNALRDQGRWAEAVGAYEAATRLQPGFAAAHHALGTALREAGRPGEAVASYRRALQLDPSSAGDVLNDIGLTFARQGNLAEAEANLRQAASIKPNDPKPRRNLGQLLLRAGRFAEAADALAALARLAPNSADAHHELATALAQAGRLDEAVAHFRRAVALRPDHAAAYCNLGVALEERGDTAGAAAAFGEALRLRPNSAVIAYHHAALAGAGAAPAPAPPACPPEYLVELFDRYADRFDEHLVAKLHYRGPELLRDAVSAATQRTDLSVLDLGCGTGLCGVLFRPAASRIVGVDLSPRMIEKSEARGVYDELVRADVVEAMDARPASADVILAADVFIYIGDLSATFRAAGAALRPGGLFAFTIEVVDDAAGDFLLRPTRRYAQSARYVRRLMSEAGLREVSATRAVLRAGEEASVEGMVFVVQRPA